MAVMVGAPPMPGVPSEPVLGVRSAQVLQEVAYGAELDVACKWLEGWSHKSRCQVLEQLLLCTARPQIQQLWTDLQPVLHRDFMYAAGKLYPGFHFTPVSTEFSRKMRKHIQAGRMGRRHHRIPSVFLRDVGDVRRHNVTRGSPSRRPTLTLKDQKRLPPLPMLRSLPALKATCPGADPDPSTDRLHLPSLTNTKDSLMASDAQHPGKGKIMETQHSWKMKNGKDSSFHPSLEKHRPWELSKGDRQQMPTGGLTTEQEKLIRWYEHRWSHKQRAEFLQKLLLQLDPRQHYFLSSFLVVMEHKDFIADLPRSISLHILSLLSPWDLLRASQVNRTWYQLCSCDEVWRPKCEDPALGVAATGADVTNWKKVFQRGYCTQQNWKRGVCRSEAVLGHTAGVCCLAHQDDLLASGSQDHTVRVWQLPECSLLRVLEGHQKGVWGLQFFTKSLLVSASSDASIKIWNIRLGACLRTLFGHNGPVWCLALVEGLLLSGSQDSKIKVWDLRHCQPVRTLRGHSQAVLALDLDRDTRRVYSGSSDKCLRIWDLDTGRCLKVLWPASPDQMPTAAIMSLSFSKGYLACSAGSWVWLYHMGTYKCLHTFRHNEKRIDCVKLKMSGHEEGSGIIFTAGEERKVKYWNIAEPDVTLRKLRGHRGRVTCFLSDDSQIFSASQDRSIRIWDFGGPS